MVVSERGLRQVRALVRVLAAALVAAVVVVCPVAAAAQDEKAQDANPLAELNAELQQVLAAAGVPFTEEQQRAIALMMEDRRRAAEDLFGGLMDFRSGPTQGQEQDRLRSAIDWMRGEFMRNAAAYMRPEQATVWEQFRRERESAAAKQADASDTAQTQYVRIHNNAFTAEDGSFSNGSGFTEVIPRGGAGAWHGNAQLLLKDDALNARNPLAGNEPAYQERRISVDVTGPTIRRRLTTGLEFFSNESKNASAVLATLPDGPFALGITHPYSYKQLSARNTLQLANSRLLDVNGWFGMESGKDQGTGGFVLPERGYDYTWNGWGADIRQFSALASQSLFEVKLSANGNANDVRPHSEALRIDVLDAFGGGGAQNRSENRNRSFNFNTLYTRVADALTIKTGAEGGYYERSRASTNNFGGAFVFSSLDDYVAGRPVNFRITRGEPQLDTTQFEGSVFVQADASVTSQLTLMFGARYDAQTNLRDYNNVSPRVSIGYSPGKATVIRGGAGFYSNRLDIGMIENQRRFDGTRQYEIVIDNPSYPDPFAAGTVRETLPSVRVTDPGLAASRLFIGKISVERTLLSNLLVSAAYNYQREFGRLRVRDLNAPFDSTSPVLRACWSGEPDDVCVRPDPARGNVLSLESTGKEVRHTLQLTARKRFSVFNVSAQYQMQRIYGDVQGGPGAALTDNYDIHADWGRAPMPLQSVSATANARLPLGVFVTAQVDANSGRYYSMTTGLDDNRDGNVTDRPPGVPPNSLAGPRYLDFDFNISKAVFFKGGDGGPNINVFANMTNAFNHVHYGTPSGVLTSPNFGRFTNASDPREIEVGIRFQF